VEKYPRDIWTIERDKLLYDLAELYEFPILSGEPVEVWAVELLEYVQGELLDQPLAWEG